MLAVPAAVCSPVSVSHPAYHLLHPLLPLRCPLACNLAKVAGHRRSGSLTQCPSSSAALARSGPARATVAMATETSASASASSLSQEVERLPTIRLMIVSDLDNTMVDHKDPNHESLRAFGELWKSKYKSDSLLVYSTGRSPTLYAELKSKVPLLTPDIVICSVGTEIAIGPSMQADKGWEQYLNNGWDRDAVVEEAKKFDKLRFQTESEQRPHKVSFHIEKNDAEAVIGPLSDRLRARGLKAKIIYSGGYDLDVLPEGAGKGEALKYLLKELKSLGKTPQHTLACGDSGNDAELFTVDGAYGVIVGNAMEELVEWHRQQPSVTSSHVFRASERCAAGIVQAIRHFDF